MKKLKNDINKLCNLKDQDLMGKMDNLGID